ncbi:PREDICTED: calcitonin receptor-like [Wasmannia auropunctata]|uniref:calcitonin receptor-like n=1 Tax=Wasmannia auropunctata TaxID=64793 RepID=UPI0005EEB7D9|nr:PREDICTED: calcitonin receptor-like [Wasmannia auropunctata]XP_011707631.1 PREDICTED: calcitonin receptor-like [Wasmannia auropunctata]
MEAQTEIPGNTTVGSTLLDEELRRILMEREQECLKLKAANATPPLEPYCRITFDGWSCWPNTPAGSTAYVPCPDFIIGFDASCKYTLVAKAICDKIIALYTFFFSPSDESMSRY